MLQNASLTPAAAGVMVVVQNAAIATSAVAIRRTGPVMISDCVAVHRSLHDGNFCLMSGAYVQRRPVVGAALIVVRSERVVALIGLVARAR